VQLANVQSSYRLYSLIVGFTPHGARPHTPSTISFSTQAHKSLAGVGQTPHREYVEGTACGLNRAAGSSTAKGLL
jgi:hypothetical protein